MEQRKGTTVHGQAPCKKAEEGPREGDRVRMPPTPVPRTRTIARDPSPSSRGHLSGTARPSQGGGFGALNPQSWTARPPQGHALRALRCAAQWWVMVRGTGVVVADDELSVRHSPRSHGEAPPDQCPDGCAPLHHPTPRRGGPQRSGGARGGGGRDGDTGRAPVEHRGAVTRQRPPDHANEGTAQGTVWATQTTGEAIGRRSPSPAAPTAPQQTDGRCCAPPMSSA